MDISSIIVDRLKDLYGVKVDDSSFEVGEYLVTLIMQKNLYLKQLIKPSPSIWIIEPKNPTRKDFGVSMVSFNRFKELQSLAGKLRRFPIEELNVLMYKDEEILTAVGNIAMYYQEQRCNAETRDTCNAVQYMS